MGTGSAAMTFMMGLNGDSQLTLALVSTDIEPVTVAVGSMLSDAPAGTCRKLVVSILAWKEPPSRTDGLNAMAPQEWTPRQLSWEDAGCSFPSIWRPRVASAAPPGQ